jgi:hypothetical protein
MAAAAYTNKTSIVSKMITHKCNLGLTMGAFGNPFQTAAVGGHAAVLDTLLGELSKYRLKSVKETIVANISREAPPSMLHRCIPEWNERQLRDWPDTFRDVLIRALATPSVENFKLIMQAMGKFPKPNLSPDELAKALDRACMHGWEDMARHLVSLGAPTQGDYYWCSNKSYPLRSASERGNVEIVQLLLDHGTQVKGGEIEEAAERGHWDVVWLLVAHGADVNGAVCGAVEKERGDILRELIKRGANIQGDVAAKALELAKEEGLESMATLLEELQGINKVEIL